jgi:hypothetical protein
VQEPLPLTACACGGLHVLEVLFQPVRQEIEDAAEDTLWVVAVYTQP